MSTSRRSSSGRGPAQPSSGARRPRVAGLRNRSQQETGKDQQETGTTTPSPPPVEETGDAATEPGVIEVSATDRDPAQEATGPTAEGAPLDDEAAPDAEPASDGGSAASDEPASDEPAPDADSAADGAGPQVSGQEPVESGRTEVTSVPPPAPEPPADRSSADAGGEAEPGGRQRLTGRATRRPAVLITILLVLTAGFGGLAFWFHSEAYSLRNEGPAANRALVDQAATSKVKGQVTDAVETLFSYDFANTGKTEKAAKRLLVGEAVQEYDKLFETVRKQAPKQKLVLTTTVRAAGVTQLQEDRAEVLLFVDQNATRTDTGQSNVGPAQLTVSAVKKGDQWKISGITPR